MQYFGGKHRIAKQLSQIITPFVIERGQYAEPFVGGASVLVEIEAPKRIASDYNIALITMWEHLANGWEPPENVSEEEYEKLKEDKDPANPLTAFAGFGASFSGKWFGGYARGSNNRNYAKSARNALRKKIERLRNVQWVASPYQDCPIPERSVIYCDPPYENTTQYGGTPPFAWLDFWEWCRVKQRESHIVFVSSYNAPSDFNCVLEVPTKLDIRTTRGRENRIERLFTPRNGIF